MTPQVTARHWAGFVAMVVGMFMAILDIQIVASSLKDIQAGLSASADEISWIQTSYLIAEKYEADAESVAGLVVVSTLVSVVSLPLTLAVLL